MGEVLQKRRQSWAWTPSCITEQLMWNPVGHRPATADREGIAVSVGTVITHYFGIESVAEADTFSGLGADSLDCVEIMMALEERFGIEIGE